MFQLQQLHQNYLLYLDPNSSIFAIRLFAIKLCSCGYVSLTRYGGGVTRTLHSVAKVIV